MPALKPISGHSRSVRAAIAYLTRGGRSLASDYLNCEEVDLLGRPTWRQIFGSFQVAIYYHDDNEGHVPHAHLVVNNANLDRPGRVSTMLTPAFDKRMYAGLQRMASERGLRVFNQEGVSARPGQAVPTEAPAGGAAPERPMRTRQRTRRSKQDSELEARGISWKRDERDRVDGPRRPASARAGGRRQAPLYANAFDTASITSTERPSLTEAHSARGKGAQRGRGKGR